MIKTVQTSKESPPKAQTLYVFSCLQVAAEAYLRPIETPPENPYERQPFPLDIIPVDTLVIGNFHSSKMPPTMAREFVQQWRVVDHLHNTFTGFSGTLFEATQNQPQAGICIGQQVMSLRSTEFIEDAVHDNEMTNQLEIKEKGFAFGQICDLVDWVRALQHQSLLNDSIILTGFSLGGHLVTAFNILHQEQTFDCLTIKNTYSFNGAGVGEIVSNTSLRAIIEEFRAHRYADEPQFKTIIALKVYKAIEKTLAHQTSLEQCMKQFSKEDVSNNQEVSMIVEAAERVQSIQREIVRIQTLTDGRDELDSKKSNPTPPDKRVVDFEKMLKDAIKKGYQNNLEGVLEVKEIIKKGSDILSQAHTKKAITDIQKVSTKLGTRPFHVKQKYIAGTELDYQIAILRVAQNTQPVNTGFNLTSALSLLRNSRRQEDLSGVTGFFDVYADNKPSMVATSQIHYGTVVGVRVEDQPLMRGSFIYELLSTLIGTSELQLLVDRYEYNSFGDTHSIALLVDTLATQALFEQLDSSMSYQTFSALIQLATSLKANSGKSHSQDKLEQGIAEGDALENIVNYLSGSLGIGRKTITHIAHELWETDFIYKPLKGNPNGGTWATIDDVDGYTGRERFHQYLMILSRFIEKNNITTKATIELFGVQIDDEAIVTFDKNLYLSGKDFSEIVALKTQCPFLLKGDEEVFWQNINGWCNSYQQFQEDCKKIANQNQDESLHFSPQWIEKCNALLTEKIKMILK